MRIALFSRASVQTVCFYNFYNSHKKLITLIT